MNSNLHIQPTLGDMMDYGVGAVNLGSPAAPSQGFMAQLQDTQGLNSPARSESSLDMSDAAMKNRNRGNYRCSKCGEPKKGHVCPLVPANFKCSRCGLLKKACQCGAPETRSIGIQVEMDEDMTTRVLDMSMQGVNDFPNTAAFSS